MRRIETAIDNYMVQRLDGTVNEFHGGQLITLHFEGAHYLISFGPLRADSEFQTGSMA
ncbi:hypothetical protein Scep_024072 [Stephania cephalantha]|uniref:Uncharacterized protein n=1 Tax=Stephania cephalantha TaxID=152367 RepID=A0AAP0EYR5_9MAGN